MIVLDASVLIAHLDGDDRHHAAALALLTDLVDQDLGVNPLTLAEVLVAPVRHDRLDPVLGLLRGLEIEELPLPSDAAVGLARLRVETGLKMPDCCVLLSAEATGSSVASFDRRLLQAAGRQGLSTVGPQDE